MPQPLPISRLSIWRLSIPMRQRFRHAAAKRACAEPLIVAIELADHTVGYGETHPRTYVTGESTDDVLATIREFFVPRLVDMRPANFAEAIEAAAALPLVDDRGRIITAARAAVELALLDAYSRSFGRPLDTVAGWLGEPWLGQPGSSRTVRFGGVISAMPPARVPWAIRKMRLLRLPHFKLKVGGDDDDARLDATLRTLRRPLASGRVSLRLDANGAWSVEQAVQRLSSWQDLPIACIEQPLPRGDIPAWRDLARRVAIPIMADESLVTPDDAEALIAHRTASWFNLRISKNGGLIPCLHLAMLARRHGIKYQLGCMVGETAILSAAGRWFLQLAPDVRFAEGSFGRFLLSDDVAVPSLRFGFGGRWHPMTGPGLGVTVCQMKLESMALDRRVDIAF